MAILTLVLQILGSASTVLQSILTGGAKNTDLIAGELIKIAQSASQAYQAHTGQPIDPTILQPIAKVE